MWSLSLQRVPPTLLEGACPKHGVLPFLQPCSRGRAPNTAFFQPVSSWRDSHTALRLPTLLWCPANRSCLQRITITVTMTINAITVSIIITIVMLSMMNITIAKLVIVSSSSR